MLDASRKEGKHETKGREGNRCGIQPKDGGKYGRVTRVSSNPRQKFKRQSRNRFQEGDLRRARAANSTKSPYPLQKSLERKTSGRTPRGILG